MVLAGVAYAVLNVWRILRYRTAFVADMRDSRTAFLIFTFVAATDVLGAAAAGHGAYTLTAILLVVGTVTWLLLGYSVPWAAVLSRSERPVTAAANGTWFAGARIVEMQSTPMVDAVRGLVAGVTVVLWGFATWLIPVLVAVGFWRHWLKKVPLRYEPTLWSIVFPLGMYAVACMYLGHADNLPIVERLGELWIWVALAAWAATFTAMVRSSFVKPREIRESALRG